jgi:hypothetical protein
MSGERTLWVKRLRSAAEGTLGKLPRIPQPGEFRDERRKQLPADEGLFAAVRSDTRWGACAQSKEPEVRLWGGAPVDAVVLPYDSSHAAGGRALVADWMQQPTDQIPLGAAVWGPRELCALHGLWARARNAAPDDRARWSRRGFEACRWLLPNLPTPGVVKVPWAVHVWVIVSESSVHEWGQGLGPEARVYAEDILRACLPGSGGGGKVDRRSAWVLWHAARELESW